MVSGVSRDARSFAVQTIVLREMRIAHLESPGRPLSLLKNEAR
jgi:hypothetical protein